MTDRIPQQGEIYKHFKGNLYQITTIATDSETGEQMVVYQALYGDFRYYVRPLDMFVSEVDHEKYPDVMQKYRFENVNNISVKSHIKMQSNENCQQPLDIVKMNSSELMEEFFDSKTYKEKLSILRYIKNEGMISDGMIGALAASIDCILDEEDLDDRYESLTKFLSTRAKYECSRLR